MSRRPVKYAVKSERGTVHKPAQHAGAASDEDGIVRLAQEAHAKGQLVLADLFCGCGGLSLGAQHAGMVPLVGVDHDPFALETWRSLFPGLGLKLDLADPDVVDRLIELLRSMGTDAIVGGPPCQPFSRAARSGVRHLVAAGRRDAHDLRRELWRSYLDIVEGVRPQAVLMENVPELALGDDTLLLRTIVQELEWMGYGVETRIVSTSDHGVPQFRQRIIIVGLLGEVAFKWPKRVELFPTLQQAIRDLPPVSGGWREDGGEGGFFEYAEPLEPGELLAWLRAGVPDAERGKIFDHVTRSVREDDREIFEAMDSTTKYSDIDERLKRYRDDIFDDKYKRLDWDQPSRTITAHLAKDGYWYIHPEQPRTITIREAARIQTFPDRVRFAGPPSAALRQIGNAVPPLAAFHLMSAVASSLEERVPVDWTTSAMSGRLQDWYQNRTTFTPPWTNGATAWQVIQGELLYPRADDRRARSGWLQLSRLEQPSDTLDRAERILRDGRQLEILERSERVLRAAEWYAQQTGPHFTDSDSMMLNPDVPRTVALLAELVSCPDESSLVVTAGVLRVAARVTGTSVDTINKNSDGRVAVARMVGGSILATDLDTPRQANLALLELASSVCRTPRPLCGECPLSQWCEYAQSQPTESESGRLDLAGATP